MCALQVFWILFLFSLHINLSDLIKLAVVGTDTLSDDMIEEGLS
jgi:hypothetical protein